MISISLNTEDICTFFRWAYSWASPEFVDQFAPFTTLLRNEKKRLQNKLFCFEIRTFTSPRKKATDQYYIFESTLPKHSHCHAVYSSGFPSHNTFIASSQWQLEPVWNKNSKNIYLFLVISWLKPCNIWNGSFFKHFTLVKLSLTYKIKQKLWVKISNHN